MLKKITQSFLTLLLMMVMGLVSANAKTEKVHATFESPSNTNTTWNSETRTFTWSTTYYNQLRNIGLPSGDISKYKKLVVDCSIVSGEKFRILFYKGGSNLTLYAENGVNEFVIKDELEKVAPNDYNEYLLACDEICLSGNNGAAPGEAVINDVYLETYDDEGAKVYATFESPSNTNTTWNADTKTFTWSTTYYNQLRNIGLPSGDISKYKKLVVDCSIVSGEKFRILFYKGGSNLTLYAENGVNEFIIKDALEAVAPNDYNEYILACDEICLSGNNGAAPGEAVINSVYLEEYPENESVEIPTIEYEEDPGKPEGDYINFTEAFPELNPKIGIGEDTHPIVLGNGDVVVGQRTKNVIADLSAYNSMTLVATPGLKMVIYMNHEVDAQQNLGDYSADDEGKYEFIEAQAGEDGLYTLDLTQYDKQDLNCICLPWDNTNKGTVWYILLEEGEAPAPVATYAITIPETENGTVTADVEEAEEGDKVTLTITPAEGYELDALSVLAGETAVQVAADNTFTMPAAAVTVSATFKEIQAASDQKVADLDKDKYHLWTGYDAEAAIADPDNPNCAYDLNKETGCVYGNSDINAGTATQFADLSDWDYLTIVAASGEPRLFFNQNDANNILVYANDANYVVSNENGVIIYDLAKFKADKGFVHLNAIKASSWNTTVNVEEMKLATVEAYLPAPKYDITIADGIENGTVAVKGGLKKAAEGDEVTLEATPVVTYELEAFSVTYNDGTEDKDVEVSAEGVFTMPAFPVTVSATFVESATPITPDAWFVADNFRVVDYKGKEDGGRIEKDGEGKLIREIPRFELEDKTTGNGSIVVTTDNNAGEDYWSQFWMKVCDEPMAEGATPLALSFRIRADRAQSIATQGHGVDWNYDNASNGYLGFGKLDVTTEWQKVTLKVEAGNGHPTNFVSVVLNLSEKNGTSNNFYIDDVQVEEYKADWYYAQEIRAKDYLDPTATYTDTDTPHPLANYVAEGGYVQVVSNASPSQPYNSQIWIQIPDEWVGKTTKMTFEVMADQVVSAPESYQATATGKGWGANAAPSASAKLEITEQDKWITIERILNTENVKSNAGAPYSSRQVDQYCVDLSNNADPITYKFRNVKFEEYVPTYAITITEAENGSVAADVTEAAEGAKVTLTITPAEGYELGALSVAAGETPVEVADDNTFTMPAAAVTVTATFKEVESGEEEYLPKPETDPDYADFEEIAQDQGKDLDDFARTAVEEGADFNTYTASGDLQVAFKMYDIDVKDCDYVTVKFAQPAPKGWNIAFWAQGGTDNVEIPEGATEYKYVFADDAKCAIKDDVLPQICVLTLWPGGYPFDMKVYGIYKHKTIATDIEGVETAEDAVKDGKYFINGQIVIVKNGKQYNANGVELK